MQNRGFGVEGLGFRVKVVGSRVEGARFEIWGSGFGVQGLGCRIQVLDLEMGGWGRELREQEIGCSVGGGGGSGFDRPHFEPRVQPPLRLPNETMTFQNPCNL